MSGGEGGHAVVMLYKSRLSAAAKAVLWLVKAAFGFFGGGLKYRNGSLCGHLLLMHHPNKSFIGLSFSCVRLTLRNWKHCKSAAGGFLPCGGYSTYWEQDRKDVFHSS